MSGLAARARAEAERHWPALRDDDERPTYPRAALREHKRGGYMAGYIAGATLDPTEAEVDAAARAFATAVGTDFDKAPPAGRHYCRDTALAVLLAAHEVRRG
jgi:hypothetical protein